MFAQTTLASSHLLYVILSAFTLAISFPISALMGLDTRFLKSRDGMDFDRQRSRCPHW